MVRVILNGCGGKMGKMITSAAAGFSGIKITAGVDKFASPGSENYPVFKSISECSEEADVILDFSRPDALDELILYAKENNMPLVLCTTGYTGEQLELIAKTSESVAVFKSANMSIGINVINAILKKVSALLYENYDIEIIEKHHNQKVDSPSGTALLLANTLKSSISEKTDFVYGREGISKRTHEEIGIHAVRGGSIVGDHDVIFAGQGEIIEFSHSALSRDVFAVGALKACEFIYGKAPGMYSMDNLVGEVI